MQRPLQVGPVNELPSGSVLFCRVLLKCALEALKTLANSLETLFLSLETLDITELLCLPACQRFTGPYS